jgi:hypothetical protein
LADQADFSASAFDAIMDLPVAGLAIEVLNEVVAVAVAVAVTVTVTVAVIIAVAITIAVIIAVAIIRAGHEIGSAAAIHPDAAPVITPCPPRNTGRIAALRSRVGKTAADENYRQQRR